MPRWSMREGGGNRIGEEQRSFFASGGEGGSSSKKDLLLPHTAADIVQNRSIVFPRSLFTRPKLIPPNCNFDSIRSDQKKGTRVRVRAPENKTTTLFEIERKGFS